MRSTLEGKNGNGKTRRTETETSCARCGKQKTKGENTMRTVRELLIVALLFFIGTLALLAVDKRCADMRAAYPRPRRSAAGGDSANFRKKQLNYSGIWVKNKTWNFVRFRRILCKRTENRKKSANE